MKRAVLYPSVIGILAFCVGCATGIPPEEVAPVYYNLGNAYSELDRQADAVKAFSKALTYDPSLFSAGYNLSRIYIEQKKYNEADAILDDLLEADPENTILLETRAWSYHLQGLAGESLDVYQEILSRVPNHTNSLFNAGVLCMELGETDQAYEYLTSLYGYTPDDVDVLLRLGFLERERGFLEEAARILELCVEKKPEHLECLETLGDIYAELRRYGDAVDCYDRAVAIEASGDLYFRKAFILLTALEDFERGMEALGKAVEAGFDDRERVAELVEYPDLFKVEDIAAFLVEKNLYGMPEEETEATESSEE